MTNWMTLMTSAAALLLGSVGAVTLPAAPAAAMPVFDATNYSQNLLQAARALEQINHQLSSLQNEATMLQNMAKNLERLDFPQLERITAALERSDQLVRQARGVDFKVDQLEAKLTRLLPMAVSQSLRGDQRVAQAKDRLDDAREALRHSMRVQTEIVTSIGEDAGLLGELVGRSQGATGALQAQQATNQLLALSTKQQFQLQQLMATEFRSQALDRARRSQAEAEARESARRFLGSGKAYRRP